MHKRGGRDLWKKITRGRDGFIVFIPPVADMDIIEKVFKDAGVRKLEEKLEWWQHLEEDYDLL